MQFGTDTQMAGEQTWVASDWASAMSLDNTITGGANGGYFRLAKIWRIGFLAGGPRPVLLEPTSYGAFSRGMRELGYVEGKDFIIEWRFAEGIYELLFRSRRRACAIECRPRASRIRPP
jgi:hypothetical protein